MEIKCPHCSSRFNLPDAAAKPGVKLRCSICKNVFPLSAEAPAAKDDTPKPKSRGKMKLWLALSLVIAILTGGASYWFYNSASVQPDLTPEEQSKKVALLTMRNVRQYYVDNEKVGKVFVIEGRVVNEFPEPKELIAVEAAIYGSDKKALATKKQLAGTQLSLFQLQVLSDKEMESFLNNKIEILSNNTNIRQGGEVPFMVLFYAPPDNVAEFGVKIVDVKDAAK